MSFLKHKFIFKNSYLASKCQVGLRHPVRSGVSLTAHSDVTTHLHPGDHGLRVLGLVDYKALPDALPGQLPVLVFQMAFAVGLGGEAELTDLALEGLLPGWCLNSLRCS